MTTIAKTFVKFNNTTGEKRPYEVFFQVEGGQAKQIGSCATEANAIKSAKDAAKRNTLGDRVTTYEG